MAVVVGLAVTIVVAQSQVLSEAQPWRELELQVTATPPTELCKLVFGTIDIVGRISCQPVEFVQLFGLCMWTIGGRENEG